MADAPVDDRGGDDFVAEDLAPARERLVGVTIIEACAHLSLVLAQAWQLCASCRHRAASRAMLQGMGPRGAYPERRSRPLGLRCEVIDLAGDSHDALRFLRHEWRPAER